MKIGINVSFLRKGDSGMGQVTTNFLKKLVELKVESEKLKVENSTFYLYAEEDFDLGVELSENFQKRVFLPAWKRDDLIRKIWWEKFLLPQKVKEDGCEVFLSLYQSTTIFKESKKLPTKDSESGKSITTPLPPPLKGGGVRLMHIMLVHDVVPKVFPEYLGNWRKRLYYRLVDKAVLKADKILTISDFSKKEIARIYSLSEEQIKVIYPDCDEVFKKEIDREKMGEVLERYGVKYDCSVNTKDSTSANHATTPLPPPLKGGGIRDPLQHFNYIFYVGGFDVRKNVDGLIRSYVVFCDIVKEWENVPDLVLAGKFNEHLVPLVTNLPEKIEWAREISGVPEGKIKNVGFVAQEDLPYLYAGAKFFVYPSFYEGFGLPVLEAANVGCPIVTSNASSIPELIDEKGAVLLDPKKTGELSWAMKKLNSNHDLRMSLVKEAKRQAEKFSWEKFVRRVLEEIEGSSSDS